jgi:NarL family two-component system sensor histidine kinase YdfH
MNKLLSLLQHVKSSPPKKDRSETFMEWPFFLILTLVFAFVYIQSVLSNTALREPPRFVLFTVLMIVHIVLHWLGAGLRKWSQVTVYLVFQCLLVCIIVFLAANIGALLGLYMGLIGEAIGLLREKPRWMVAAVAVLLGLSLLNYILQVGVANWHWWLLAMLPMTFFVVVYVGLYSRQAEARARALILLKELEEANRQLSEYASRVEDLTIVAERQRMARELHDTLSQGLAGLILQLEAADAYLAGNRPERARGILQQSMEKARGTLAEARQVIDDLRQPGEPDLVEAVLRETGRFADATGIPCEPQIDINLDVPELVAETAIRAISEGLTNIARHARAKNTKLRIATITSSKELEIEIIDDGIGFEPLSVDIGHYGLLGMRERVRLAGGSLEIQSAPGKGTMIVIRFPLVNTAYE